MTSRLVSLAAMLALAACGDPHLFPAEPPASPVHAAAAASGPQIVINEILADPNAVTDDVGEWFEVHNAGTAAVNLQGWTIVSNNDAAHTIATSVNVAAGGYAVLARNGRKQKNGGVTAQYAYGTGITLANSADWLVLRDGAGATVDSVSWTSSQPVGAARGVKDPTADNLDVGGANWQTQTTTFGKGDKGTPGAQNDGFTPPPGQITTVTVAPAAATITVGATQQFTATARDAGGNVVPTTFTWSSSNAAVATVDQNGVATGVAAGSAQIRATAPNAVFGEAALTVTSGGGGASELVVRILDIGQGDGAYVTNGTSKVFIDGGPDTTAFRQHLDALGIQDTVIDYVIISHAHFDHYSGLRELFKTYRGITIRYLFENKDAGTAITLGQLRDSINARAARGELIYVDTDNPCGDGSAVCTLTLAGGAKLHILRPDPNGATPNNRSTAVKLVGPDSASFTMWFAGDAEHGEIGWFDTIDYDVSPGMDVNVVKEDHHGSCNGITTRYMQLLTPDWVAVSLGATNTFGHIHTQTKDLLRQLGIPWYRTDQNGTITVRTAGTPGGGYTISRERGQSSMDGPSDATSGQTACANL